MISETAREFEAEHDVRLLADGIAALTANVDGECPYVAMEDSSPPTQNEKMDASETEAFLENGDDNGNQELDPWSSSYVGIQVNYFCVGVFYSGTYNILYPILVIQKGVTTSFYTAAVNLVQLFWSYKILFGITNDCFPLFGYKAKSYIIFGWVICTAMLAILIGLGPNVSSSDLVLVLTFVNFGYVMTDTAADGFLTWMSHKEPIHRRGSLQALIFMVRELGRIFVNIIIIFGFSGPEVACPGYESDWSVNCTTDEDIMDENDMVDDHPENWCHLKCGDANFDFGLTIPQYATVLIGIILISMPSYFLIKEEKSIRESFHKLMSSYWKTVKRRAVWQIMLYCMISHMTFDVVIAPKVQANYEWLNLSTIQNQIIAGLESLMFFVGLSLVRTYALNYSWRKLIWIGKGIVSCFNGLYLLIVYDVIRSAWFYAFTDVSASFLYTLNYITTNFAIIEVAEPGLEFFTYSLIATASNSVRPLSNVISYQLMVFFPDLNDQDTIEEDTQSVRNQFALLILITEIINLTSFLSLPLLPRQKQETRELNARGETSVFAASFTIISMSLFLLYSTVVTFVTVAAAHSLGCYKVFGGEGCSDDESSIPVSILLGMVFLYCYGVSFYFSFWPILKGREKFSCSMFF